jgi:hypothetical protein
VLGLCVIFLIEKMLLIQQSNAVCDYLCFLIHQIILNKADMAILLQDILDPSSILKRLKYPNDAIKQIKAMVQQKDAVLTDRISLRKFLSSYPADPAPYLAYRSALNPSFPSDVVQSLYASVIQDNDCVSLNQLNVRGNDLTVLGYQGKEISDTLQELLQAVMEEKVPNKKEKLIAYIKTR